MVSETVLVTGGTGHLGFKIIVEALKAGYNVKIAVRSQAKADEVFATSAIKFLNPGERLRSVLVPDMLVDRAYDEAIKDTTYAVHVASPISSVLKDGDDADEVLIKPAVKGTLNILEAAKKAGNVKRVVITSSIVAIIPFAELTSGDTSKVYNEKSRAATPTGPYPSSFAAYASSKVAALNATEKWITDEKPSFDVVNIFPGYIIGSEDLTTDAKKASSFGTNPVVLGPALGGDAGFHLGSSIHVDDTALAHVKALDSSVPGNQGYVTSQTTRWEDAAASIAKNFPQAVRSGQFPNNGKIVTVPIKIDEKKSEEVLGIKYQGLEEQVKSAAGQYLTLL
ncbi:hypothetical protein BDV96DRAFT_496951 [Lophiotrema nucula]|uniref:NAD-dependent epimerase/dehydratase domain-containing protein n=1 Tax=Lophiotrema nucula TaxID=690887 RepID=A0A6A5Z0C8_9PLEO|nr:hypothetical protein BDV96DRAFT_496951 [Lophiotrema nucula]